MMRFLLSAVLLLCVSAIASAAEYRTANFHITAPTDTFAKAVGDKAEFCREQQAIQWLGNRLPGNWTDPCVVTCKVGEIGAGGATTFTFNNGEVYGWRMDIQGTEQAILDSVLPHEVNHTIFACHFRRALPRWADEGAATCMEDESERKRQGMLLSQVVYTSKRIPCRNLIVIAEYPADMQDVLTLYAEGYALTDYLVRYKGRREFVAFLATYTVSGWDVAFQQHYGISVDDLDSALASWVLVNNGEVLPTQFAELSHTRFSRGEWRQIRKGGE